MFGSMGQTNVKNLGNGGTMDGDVTITGDLTVSGGISLSLNEVLQGTSTIDINSTEALLVRKDGDGGDVFIVDTTNMDVTVNGVKNTTTFSVTNNWSTTNDFIQIALNDATIRSTVLDSGARNLILAPLGNDALTLHSTSGGVVSVGIGITPTVDLDISSSSGDVQARLFRNANVKTSLTFKNSLQEWEIGNSVGDNNKFTIRDITDSRNAFVIDGSGDTSFSGTATVSGGVLTLGTADSTSGHINAFENMSFNIDTDNDDTNRFFEFNINGNSGAGTELMRLTEGGFLGIGTTPESALHINTSSSGGIGGKLIIDNQASTADGNGTEISFFNGSGASASGVANSRIRSVSTGNTNGYSELQFYGYNTGGEALRMVIAKDGKLGVGTSSPEERIHSTGAIVSTGVNDTGATAGTERAFIDLVSNKARIGHFRGTTSAGSGGLQFYTDSVERARIDASGRLGLGISDPDAYLSGARNLVLGGTSGDHGLTIRTASDSKGIIAFGDGDASSDAGYRGQIQYLHSSDKMLFMTSTTNRMAIDSSGVGIGTSSPVGTLTINSDTAEDGVIITTTNTDAGGSADQGLGLDWRFTSVSSYPWAYVRAIFQGSGDTELAFGTKPASAGDNVAERMRIDNAGNVGIGTTTIDAKLVVAQASADTALKVSREDQANIQLIASGRGSVRSSASLALQTGGANIRMLLDDNSRISISNNGGLNNTTFGYLALNSATSNVANNVAIGHETLKAMDGTETGNVALGYQAMLSVDENVNSGSGTNSANFNIAIGHQALTGGQFSDANDSNNKDFVGNIAIGANALDATGTNPVVGAVAIGQSSLTAMTSGTGNTAVGYISGASLTTGSYNTFIGDRSGDGTDDGNYNVALGYLSLSGNCGDSNTALGMNSLSVTTASSNTAVGYYAGNQISSGGSNVAVGKSAGQNLTTGSQNTVLGTNALPTADGGEGNNVAIGMSAMMNVNNDNADDNICIGVEAGKGGTGSLRRSIAIGTVALDATGSNNVEGAVAIGYGSLGALTSGSENCAVGFQSLKSITTGIRNTAIGYNALSSADNDESNNTCVGYSAGSTIDGSGGTSIMLGALAQPSTAGCTNQIVIGYNATGQGDNSVTLGNASVTAVYMAQDSGATVYCSGVNFPDSQVASSDANTLDDYEEGTYTPVVSNGSSNYSASVENGYYTKIGDQVFVQVNITSSEAGSGGALQVTLPFNYNGASNKFITASVRYGGLDLDANCVQLMLGNSSSGTSNLLFFSQQRDDNTQLNLSADAYSSGDTFQFNVHYKVA